METQLFRASVSVFGPVPHFYALFIYTDFVGEDKGEEWKGCCNEILNNQKVLWQFPYSLKN